MNEAFWRGRVVAITGHTGFKGSWLCEWLLSMGAKLSGYALSPPTDPALFDQLGLEDRLDHRLGDVREFSDLANWVKDSDPEIVFHMAAQPLVRRSYAEPLETFAVNIMGTAHLLESSRARSNIKAIVVVTTDKCYENREWDWGYRENEALGGHDPYSSSKACAELVTQAYRNSFFCGDGQVPHLATARAGNVIGGGDWAEDRLIPDAVRAFANGSQVAVRYPDAVRPWQHVLEPLRGYLTLAERLASPEGAAFAEAWNFGPSERDARSVRWVLDRFNDLWPGAPGWTRVGPTQPHEAGFLKLDCSKAAARLAWKPVLSLDTALSLTAEWYRAAAAGQNPADVMRAQIDEYMVAVRAIAE